MAFLETMAKLIERYNSFFTEGIVNTLIIAAFSVLFGAILGTQIGRASCRERV